MNTLTLNIMFLIGVFSMNVIRMPHQRKNKHNVIVDNRKTTQENGLLFLVVIGAFFLPMTYILTPWLEFADYTLPTWANILGMAIFAIALWLFWKSHHDLGRNWSPTLQVRDEHTLITEGIYQMIRHPMYTSIWLSAIAQGLLLMNWIAGLSGFIAFGTLYIFRVGNEEKMMQERFGEQYQAYMAKTKRLIPYLL